MIREFEFVAERPVWSHAVPCRLAVLCGIGQYVAAPRGTLRAIAPHAAHGMVGTGIGMGLNGHKVPCAECPDEDDYVRPPRVLTAATATTSWASRAASVN
jgi:hypothetical protein